MKYFNISMSMEQIKKTYREWAFKLHSDVGGNDEAMKDLNVQFEYAYKYAKKKHIILFQKKKRKKYLILLYASSTQNTDGVVKITIHL